jgi:putative redox protein
MVHIDISYEGTLRCRAVHGPSSVELLTDAPVDNHGKGQSFAPTDLVAGALGACMVTIMGIAAEKHGWEIEGTKVIVEKEMTASPVRRIGKVELRIEVAGVHDQKARRILERSAYTCPVKQSLHPDVELAISFVWASA